jgi:uncharacterized LabA/DUF88 family protein
MRDGKEVKSIFKALFGGKKTTKKKAVAFVDYEHWYISLSKLYKQKPLIKQWYEKLSEEYKLEEVYFFADFAGTSLKEEVPRIREVTNFIIETGASSPKRKKDFTDFIMLDRIYQTAMSRYDIDVYIIFSGDGHFPSVAQFLRGKLKKTVGIYGVKDAFSQQLKNTATWIREIPDDTEKLRGYYYPILENIHHLEANNVGGKIVYPTFRATVEAVTKYYKLPYKEVRDALAEMVDSGYISQKEIITEGKELRTLEVDWNKVRADGIWNHK